MSCLPAWYNVCVVLDRPDTQTADEVSLLTDLCGSQRFWSVSESLKLRCRFNNSFKIAGVFRWWVALFWRCCSSSPYRKTGTDTQPGQIITPSGQQRRDTLCNVHYCFTRPKSKIQNHRSLNHRLGDVLTALQARLCCISTESWSQKPSGGLKIFTVANGESHWGLSVNLKIIFNLRGFVIKPQM